MYVGTFSLQRGAMLVRVDVESNGLNSRASYAITFASGEVASYNTPLALDAVGPAVMAVIDLIRDLRFADMAGSIELVQGSPQFTQTELDTILEGATVNAYIDSIGTSASIQ
jgi:hypothetical protein